MADRKPAATFASPPVGLTAPDDPLLGLAAEAARGDLEATRKLLDRVSPRIAGVARAVLGPGHAEVDDAVQQSLIAVMQALPRFRGECPPVAYASAIAVRVCVGMRRRGRARRQHEEALAAEPLSWEEPPSPGETTAAGRRKALLRGLLEQIPAEQGEALAMRAVLGWSLEEIAGASGAPLNTVRSRIRLAKEALRRRIEADPRLAEELDIGS